jgi:cyclase
MRRIRVIPSLLLERRRLVKTERFGARTYIGDPVNTVKIFNDKQVDEILVLDIAASRDDTGPDVALVRELASECFMPLAYGGGIATLEQARAIFSAGVEKIVINAGLYDAPDLIGEVSAIYGAQAVVASIDARKGRLTGRYGAVTHGASRRTGVHPVAAAERAVAAGAGEVMICNVDHDGVMQGYDLKLTRAVADAVPVPVIASGGAGSTADLVSAVREGHASAVAAGALFVFKGPHRAVLVNYPSQAVLAAEVYSQI